MKINRKNLKKKGRQVFRANYLCAVAICFVLSFVGAEYISSTSFIKQNDAEHIDNTQIVYEYDIFENWKSLKESAEQIIGGIKETDASDTNNENIAEAFTNEIKKGTTDEHGRFSAGKALYSFYELIFNSFTETSSYIFKFITGSLNIFADSEIGQGLLMLFSGIFELLLSMFILKMLLVGGKRFFTQITRNKSEKARFSTIFYPFKCGHYRHCVWVSFTQSVFWTLWSLTIVGSVIKMYEYRMIPYILADNPELSRKQIFALSKQMMRGHKWQLFKFDLSYIGWHILSWLTMGLLGIFYVNPYKASAEAQIYEELKAFVSVNGSSEVIS